MVRMETITPAGEGNSLPEPPGAPLPQWVQSQTTYAALEKKADGGWGVRVLKQKIWVEGVSYELQERGPGPTHRLYFRIWPVFILYTDHNFRIWRK